MGDCGGERETLRERATVANALKPICSVVISNPRSVLQLELSGLQARLVQRFTLQATDFRIGVDGPAFRALVVVQLDHPILKSMSCRIDPMRLAASGLKGGVTRRLVIVGSAMLSTCATSAPVIISYRRRHQPKLALSSSSRTCSLSGGPHRVLGGAVVENPRHRSESLLRPP